MKIYLEPLLHFLDDPEKGDNRHASALIGFLGEDLNAAAFAKYLTDGETHTVTVISQSPSPGTKSGKRLDRWIYVKEHESKDEVVYQCEIKNWAASAVGGLRLPISCSEDEMRKVATTNWANQLKNSYGGSVQPNGVTKVLMPMRSLEQYNGMRVEPLLLYWMPILNPKDNSMRPFFSIAVADLGLPTTFTHAPFDILHVFSVSMYLRELLKQGKESVDLWLPGVERRIEILSKIVPNTSIFSK